MITVPEAARRTGKHPETIRRWIREGKLSSTRVGTQHLVDETEVGDLANGVPDVLPMPDSWLSDTLTRELADKIVLAVRRERSEH